MEFHPFGDIDPVEFIYWIILLTFMINRMKLKQEYELFNYFL